MGRTKCSFSFALLLPVNVATRFLRGEIVLRRAEHLANCAVKRSVAGYLNVAHYQTLCFGVTRRVQVSFQFTPVIRLTSLRHAELFVEDKMPFRVLGDVGAVFVFKNPLL